MRATQRMLSARTGCGCEPRTVTSKRIRPPFVGIAALVLACTLFANSTGAYAATTSIGAGLRGPSGLRATVYAKNLKKISALATDAEGRVWASTAEATDKDTDAISVIDAAGATPRKVVTDVHTPLGLVWIGDSLYVSERGEIEVFSGFDGAAFGSRTTIVSFADDTGEVNGIAQGADGRISVGISAPATRARRRSSTPPRSSRSSPTGPISRSSPTGSGPRSVSRSSPAPTTCS